MSIPLSCPHQPPLILLSLIPLLQAILQPLAISQLCRLIRRRLPLLILAAYLLILEPPQGDLARQGFSLLLVLLLLLGPLHILLIQLLQVLIRVQVLIRAAIIIWILWQASNSR